MNTNQLVRASVRSDVGAVDDRSNRVESRFETPRAVRVRQIGFSMSGMSEPDPLAREQSGADGALSSVQCCRHGARFARAINARAINARE